MILLTVACILIILTAMVFLASGKKTIEVGSQGIYPGEGAASDDDVLRLLRSGNKIHAIKCYRKIYGVGLKEAKEAVERMDIS